MPLGVGDGSMLASSDPVAPAPAFRGGLAADREPLSGQVVLSAGTGHRAELPPEGVRCKAAAAGTMVLLKDTLFDPAGLRVLLGIAARDKTNQSAPGDPNAVRRNLAGLHPK